MKYAVDGSNRKKFSIKVSAKTNQFFDKNVEPKTLKKSKKVSFKMSVRDFLKLKEILKRLNNIYPSSNITRSIYFGKTLLFSQNSSISFCICCISM